jgi:hypothetical protein
LYRSYHPSSVFQRRTALAILAPTTFVVAVLIYIGAANATNVLSLRWYLAEPGGGIKVLNSKTLTIADGWISKDHVTVPVRLALRNVGSDVLRDVRVEIAYPDDVQVRASVREEQVSSTGHSLIFDHVVGELHAGSNYVLLNVKDELSLPTRSWSFTFLTPMGKVPLDYTNSYLAIAGNHKEVANCWFRTEVPLTIKVFPDGSLRGTSTLRVSTGAPGRMRVIAPHQGLQPLKRPSLRVWTLVYRTQRLSPRADWTRSGGIWGKRTVSYSKVKLGVARAIFLGVDHRWRRVIIDSNGDGFRDIDVVFDGATPGLAHYTEKIPLGSITPDSIREQVDQKFCQL